MPSAYNKKKTIEQQLQRRDAEWTVNIDYLQAMIQVENLENINFPYESLFQQKLQKDKLYDDFLTYNLLKKNWMK